MRRPVKLSPAPLGGLGVGQGWVRGGLGVGKGVVRVCGEEVWECRAAL